MVRKAIVILALMPVSAAAQNSTTNCQRDYFGNLACQTLQQPGIDWSRAQQPQPNPGDAFTKSFNEAQARRRQQERDELFRQALEQRQQPVAPPSAQAEALAAACDREFSKALEARDIKLAESIAAICK